MKRIQMLIWLEMAYYEKARSVHIILRLDKFLQLSLKFDTWYNYDITFYICQPINDSKILLAIDSWNSGANCSMKVFAKGMSLIFLLRRENVNLIQYNIETTHAIQING